MISQNSHRRGRRQQFTAEEHVLRGTYRADRCGPLAESTDEMLLYSKPVPGRRHRVAKRWLTGPNDHAAVAAGCWFDEKLGRYACDWIERFLTLVEGVWSGKPFKLMSWQRDIVMHLFGWIRRDKEWDMVVRRYRRALVLVPKKSGKSPFAAALGLYLANGDSDEQGADVAIIATDKIQASNVGKHCIRMVRRNPALSAACSINENLCRIVNNRTDSLCRTLAHNPAQLEGLNLNGCICDELHVWKDARVWDTIHYAGVSRPNFLQLAISTAGDDVSSLCYQQYEHCKAVERGDVTDIEFLGRIWEADIEDDWTDPAVWKKANPSLGVTIKRSELQASCDEAKHNSRIQNSFKRYRLNIWSQPEQAWLDMEYWAACGADIKAEDYRGSSVIVGLDLAKTRDLTAAVVMVRPEPGIICQFPYFWMPEEMARRKNHLVPYLDWAARGYLHLTPGDVCDYNYVLEQIRELSEVFTIECLLYDPWNAEHFTQRLYDELSIERIAFQQSIRNFNAPCREYERRILNGTLRHPNHPILNWQASHVLVRSDENQNIRPVKREQGDYRTIDGIVAGIMAMAKAIEEPSEGFVLSLG